jgi:chromosome segregation ATPase
VADRLRAEKTALSIAARETAAERLRLATALRELKERHARLRGDYARLQAEKDRCDADLAAAHVELAALREAAAKLRAEAEVRAEEVEGLKAEAGRLEAELRRASGLASSRMEQLRELNSVFEQARAGAGAGGRDGWGGRRPCGRGVALPRRQPLGGEGCGQAVAWIPGTCAPAL